MTGSGGYHIYMAKPEGLSVKDSLPEYPGIEYKSFGRQVVAPGSIHPDTHQLYVAKVGFLADFRVLPELTQKLSERIGRSPNSQNRSERTQKASDGSGEDVRTKIDAGQIAELLPLVSMPGKHGNYDDWIKLPMSAHFASDGDLGVLEELEAWCEADADIRDKWDGFGNHGGAPVTFGTLAKLARQYCVPGKEAEVDAWIVKARAAGDFSDAEDPADLNAMTENDPVAETVSKRKIRLRDGYQDKIVADATEGLMEALCGQILQQNGGLVRPVVLDATQSVEGVVRFNAGMTVLLPVTTDWLWLKLSEKIRFYRMTQQSEEKGGELKATPADPPKKLAALIQANIGKLPFYTVRAMVTAPTIDLTSGEIIDVPGINPRTGLLAVFDPGEFPTVKRGLTQAEAKERLDEVFHDLLRGFPFDDGERGASAAVAMSTLITPLLRATMVSAPLHAIDAAAPGTGKTMLSEISGILATGAKPAASAWSRDEEENEKRLGAALMQKASVLLLDNLEAKKGDKLEGNMMCMVLTSEMVSIRVLGTHGKANLSTKTFIMATGNNIVVAGDMVRRVVKCRLDAKMARPETRSFNFVPTELANERRGVIVASILEAVAAYIDAGRPCDGDVAKLGGFESWTTIQGLLKWCGWEDPARTIDAVRATDTSRHETEEALEAWHMAFGDEWVTPKEVEDLIRSAQGFEDMEDLTSYEHYEAITLMQETLLEGKDTTAWIGRIFGTMGAVTCGDYYLEAEKGSRSSRARLRKG